MLIVRSQNQRPPSRRSGRQKAGALSTKEVRRMLEQINSVKQPTIIHGGAGCREIGTCHILFHQDPAENVPFIQIRDWETLDGTLADLVVEYGFVNEEDDLESEVHVLLGKWEVPQALEWVKDRIAQRP